MKQPPAYQVVDMLKWAGWVEDGYTPTETYRVKTGELTQRKVTVGGRMRFRLPSLNVETQRRVTVGARTVYFYRVNNGETSDHASFATKDIDAIRAYLEQS